MVSTRQVIVGSLAVLATGVVGYATWFDYKRRNDPEFRRKLSKCNGLPCLQSFWIAVQLGVQTTFHCWTEGLPIDATI